MSSEVKCVCLIYRFFNRSYSRLMASIASLKNGHSINYKSTSVYPLFGVWILDETVGVVFEILLYIITTL